MCGIVGVVNFEVSGLFAPDIDIFKQLLIVDSVRGSDGTGAFAINKGGNSTIAKIEGSPYNFLKNPAADSFFTKAFQQSKGLIGHNRWATRGGISSDSSHPFRYKNIVLVHNGTLNNHYSFPEFNQYGLKVDSNLLPVLLQEREYKDVFSEVDGAFAIVFHDERSHHLNIIRNKERPLYFGINKKEGRLYISSEMGALEWILARNNAETGTIIYDTAPGRMYKFNMKNTKPEWETEEFKFYNKVYTPPKENPLPLPKPPEAALLPFPRKKGGNKHLQVGSYVYFDLIDTKNLGKDKVIVHGTLPWSNHYQVTCVVGKSMEDQVIAADGLRGKISKIRELKGNKYNGYTYNVSVTDLITVSPVLSKNGRYLTPEDIDKVKEEGCAVCKQQILQSDYPKSIWNAGAKVIFCPQCSIAEQSDLSHPLFPIIDSRYNSHLTH